MRRCTSLVRMFLLVAGVPLDALGQQANEIHAPDSIEQKVPNARAANAIADLPLVEVPASGDSDLIAVFFSGSGGWQGLYRSVSAQLAAAGVPVVGINSLRYFWSARSPDQAAEDLARVLAHYLPSERPQVRILLIGYSTGADVLPFLVNRLPQNLRTRIATLNLIAPGHEALFEIRLADWIPKSARPGAPLLPEIERIPPLPLLCLYGRGDESTLCPALPHEYGTVTRIGEGHHLGGKYEAIAARILSFAGVGQKDLDQARGA